MRYVAYELGFGPDCLAAHFIDRTCVTPAYRVEQKATFSASAGYLPGVSRAPQSTTSNKGSRGTLFLCSLTCMRVAIVPQTLSYSLLQLFSPMKSTLNASQKMKLQTLAQCVERPRSECHAAFCCVYARFTIVKCCFKKNMRQRAIETVVKCCFKKKYEARSN